MSIHLCQFPWVSVRKHSLQAEWLKATRKCYDIWRLKVQDQRAKRIMLKFERAIIPDCSSFLVACGQCLALLDLQVCIFSLLFNHHVAFSLCLYFTWTFFHRDLGHIMVVLRAAAAINGWHCALLY